MKGYREKGGIVTAVLLIIESHCHFFRVPKCLIFFYSSKIDEIGMLRKNRYGTIEH